MVVFVLCKNKRLCRILRRLYVASFPQDFPGCRRRGFLLVSALAYIVSFRTTLPLIVAVLTLYFVLFIQKYIWFAFSSISTP